MWRSLRVGGASDARERVYAVFTSREWTLLGLQLKWGTSSATERGLTMEISVVFDWFTQESIAAALQATEWEQREIWLRLAWLWSTAAREYRENASSTPSTAQEPPSLI